MKGMLHLRAAGAAWEPEGKPDPKHPYAIALMEGDGTGVIVRMGAKALGELEAAIARAREEHRNPRDP